MRRCLLDLYSCISNLPCYTVQVTVRVLKELTLRVVTEAEW